jgi:serine/threonine protein kinase
LNKNGVCHGDLKLENILYDPSFNLKIIDFGLSEHQNTNCLMGERGTRYYMAPEIIKNQTYDGFKIDIFSLGILMFCLVRGHFPWT